MEDDNIIWDVHDVRKYAKWDYRHPDYFEADPQQFDEELKRYGHNIYSEIEHKLYPTIKWFQAKYPNDRGVWYACLGGILESAELYFVEFVYGLEREYKSNENHASYLSLISDIRKLNAEFNYTEKIIIWQAKPLNIEYRQFTWKDRERIATAFKIDFVQERLQKLKQYFEDLHPEWIDTQKKASQTHLEPPYSAQKAIPDQRENVQHKPPESPTKDSASILDGVKWKERYGSKSDLAELIKGLFYMKVIEKDGRDIQLNELQAIFQNVFNVSIADLDQAFSKRMKTYKAQDQNTFTDKLESEFYKGLRDEIRKERNQKDT